jgi:hypothetical protein
LSVSFSAPVKVFILSGQSNMVGVGKVSELSAVADYTFPNIRAYVAINGEPSTRFINPLQPGATSNTVPEISKQWFGPELGIARVLTARYPEEKLIFIKVACGGTGLESDWLSNGNLSSCGLEVPLYTWFLSNVKRALSDIKIHGDRPVYSGFIWMQGESDANDPGAAKRYGVNLRAFFHKIRADISNSIPIVYGVIANARIPNTPCLTYTAGMQVQIEQYLTQSLVNKCYCTDKTKDDSVWLGPDSADPDNPNYVTAHYNTRGVLDAGEQLGRKMVDLLDGKRNSDCYRPFYEFSGENPGIAFQGMGAAASFSCMQAGMIVQGIIVKNNVLSLAAPQGARYSVDVYDACGRNLQTMAGTGAGRNRIAFHREQYGSGIRIFVVRINGSIVAKFRDIRFR